MKTRVFAVILIFLLILPLGVNAQSDNFTLGHQENFVGAYKNGDKGDLSQKLGISESETEALFGDKALEYFAISDDRTTQFSISVYSNDLSWVTGDTSRLDSEALKSFASSLLQTPDKPYEIKTENDIVYIVLNEDVENSKGKSYYSSEYITVVNAEFYHLTFISSNPSAKADIENIVSSFKINKESKEPISAVYILLIVLAIALFIAVAAVMLVGIIKRLKQKKAEQIAQQESQYKEIIEE